MRKKIIVVPRENYKIMRASIFEAAHRVGDRVRASIADFTPVPTESQFLEEGTLTPAEFLQAGEQLCFKFPSWQWEAGNERNRANYLPEGKQYLITRRTNRFAGSLSRLDISRGVGGGEEGGGRGRDEKFMVDEINVPAF